MAFTVDRAITGIQEVNDFDCQCMCVKQVKAFLGTTAHYSRSTRYCFFGCLMGIPHNLSPGMGGAGGGGGVGSEDIPLKTVKSLGYPSFKFYFIEVFSS